MIAAKERHCQIKVSHASSCRRQKGKVLHREQPLFVGKKYEKCIENSASNDEMLQIPNGDLR